MRPPSTSGWVKLSELPKPIKWFYRGTKRRRDVEVKLFVCPGFTHTYADLNEEDDVVWDPRDRKWKKPEAEIEDPELAEVVRGQFMDHKLASGRRYHNRFVDATAAERWVLRETKSNFPPATHRLVDWNYPHPVWKPKRIGKTKEQLATKCAKCKLAIRDRGTHQSGDWTGGPYCDICISHAPAYGDHEARRKWDRVTAAQAQKWTKEKP